MTLQQHLLGTAECLASIREVFRQDVNESLLLRALTWFEDAEREAPLPSVGKEFFLERVGSLPVPPTRGRVIQGRVVDVALASPAGP